VNVDERKAPDPIINALRLVRKALKLSQQGLAQRLGRKTYQTVWQWESGSTDPTLRNVREWADALGYDLTLIARQEHASPCCACGTNAIGEVYRDPICARLDVIVLEGDAAVRAAEILQRRGKARIPGTVSVATGQTQPGDAS